MSEVVQKPLVCRLYVQVLLAIIVGVVLGHMYPSLGVAMKPLGDGFIKLIKMLIGPIVFLTVSIGIGKMNDMKAVGRVGCKALLYFEVVSLIALMLGLIFINMFTPGRGLNIDVNTLDASTLSNYVSAAHAAKGVGFFLNIIPHNMIGAFAEGNILQILLVSVLFGLSMSSFGKGRQLLSVLEQTTQAFFGMVKIVMKLAPIGAFGAMAFTMGKYGLAALLTLGKLVACVYFSCAFFIVVVLGLIAKLSGFSLWRFLSYIREEIILVLGTSSSESALPRIMSKLENLGCAKSVVGMVVPTGYSFNLDGTSIYLTMAAVFIAQAANIDLTITEQLSLLMILFFTSKGAAAVSGGGFIVLVSTLSAIDTLPVAGVALLIGVDKFMSEARAITNLIGNGVGTILIAKWERALDTNKLDKTLSSPDMSLDLVDLDFNHELRAEKT